MPPSSIVRAVPNGKPSFETSSEVAAASDVAGARTPDPERRQRRRRVVELGRTVGRQVVAEPLAVAHPVGAAGHDPEVVAPEAHDRQVRLDPAGLVEERRVDDPSDRDVHLGDGHPLDVVECARPGDVEDGEGRQVDHPDPVAHGEVLGVDDRRPPARFPLGIAGHDPVAVLREQLLVGGVPERSLPAGRLEEDRPELALACVERAQPDVAVARPLLGRVDDPVGLVEALGGTGLDVRARLLVVVEAGDVRAVRVDLGLPVGHPLGDHPGDPGRLLDPDRGSRPEALDLGRLAQDRHPVRGQRQQAVDRVTDPDPLVAEDVRDELERLLHLELEVLLRERQLGRREGRFGDRGDLVGVHQDRPVGVRADLHVAAVLALVAVRVHVAHDRVGDLAHGVGQHRDGPDADHLVDRRA